ncbi:hypothetical protein [Pseudonocardia spinosispora]|uniref:hypothetical protein n=1 Tax=Pseudonocardia spinosispora TaxID=103441 RepID=UPI00041CF702|nr:hypothetical protein [Pseudonocardia spinosispora]
MGGTLVVLLLVVALVAGGVFLSRQRAETRTRDLEDARSEARRWVERLGGSVLNLQGTDDASRQAMADASERYTAAGSQLDQARTVVQCRQVTETAYEGLYYVRAARTAMGLDPGPELPPLPGQRRAGSVTEARDVEVEGHRYSASPSPSVGNSHYYPGGTVAGRQVPAGWYSEPWWKTALVAGAWGVGSFVLFDALFSGMDGAAYADGFQDAQALGAADAFGADQVGDVGGFGDFGGFGDAGGDWTGGDNGGGFF